MSVLGDDDNDFFLPRMLTYQEEGQQPNTNKSNRWITCPVKRWITCPVKRCQPENIILQRHDRTVSFREIKSFSFGGIEQMTQVGFFLLSLSLSLSLAR